MVFILKLKFVAVVTSFGTVQKSKEFGQTRCDVSAQILVSVVEGF